MTCSEIERPCLLALCRFRLVSLEQPLHCPHVSLTGVFLLLQPIVLQVLTSVYNGVAHCDLGFFRLGF